MAPRILYFTIFPLVWITSWILVAGVSFEVRPFATGHEQAPLALAWSLWRDGGFLHTGIGADGALIMWPLLIWIIDLGWSLFGVSEWWPRLIGYAVGLLCVFLTAGMARLLWPGWTGLGAMSGTALSASVVWLILSGMLGPYPIAVAIVISALYALVWYWRTGRRDGHVYYGTLMGACVLTIGPVGWFLCGLPALLAPLWGGGLAEQIDDNRSPPHGWWRWYAACAIAGAVSFVPVAAWAGIGVFQVISEDAPVIDVLSTFSASLVPAIGELRRLWWPVLVAVIAMGMPWIFWAPAWRSLMGMKHVAMDGGARLCVLWLSIVAVPVIMLTGLQFTLMCLALPPVCLLMAFLVFLRADRETTDPEGNHRFGTGETTLGLVLVTGGAVMLVAPFSGAVFDVPAWLTMIRGGWGGLLIALGALIAYAIPRLVDLRMMLVSVISTLTVIVGTLAAEPVIEAYLDPRPAAEFVAGQFAQGNPVAFVGPYEGQFDFPARLEEKITILPGTDARGRAAWIAGNPGAVIAQIRNTVAGEPQPLATFPVESRYIVFWSRDTVLNNPVLIDPPQ